MQRAQREEGALDSPAAVPPPPALARVSCSLTKAHRSDIEHPTRGVRAEEYMHAFYRKASQQRARDQVGAARAAAARGRPSCCPAASAPLPGNPDGSCLCPLRALYCLQNGVADTRIMRI